MKSVTPFYILGSTGIAVTGLLHIVVACLTQSGNLSIWAPLYVTWLIFMSLGTVQMVNPRSYPPSGKDATPDT